MPSGSPLAVYATTRLIDALFIVLAARHQIALPKGATGLAGYNIWEPSPASPGYGAVASNWDGQWYFSIATHGYPTDIPRDAARARPAEPMGFYPIYPLLVGAIVRITWARFLHGRPLLSFLLGAAAVTVMFRLISQSSGRFAASATVLLTCTYMAAPAMQIAYTESLALLLVCTALLLLRNRRYGWLIPVLVTLALTRAIALAFVPVLVVHGIYRWRGRSVDPFPVSDRRRVAGVAFFAIAVTGLWPAIAGAATGDPAAYTQTMSSWGTTGKLRVLIEFPAFALAEWGVGGLVALIGVVGLIATLVLRRGAGAWGPEVRAWAGFYPLYLLLATGPGTSNIRHLVLAFPLMWPFPEATTSAADSRRRTAMVVILAICGLATAMGVDLAVPGADRSTQRTTLPMSAPDFPKNGAVGERESAYVPVVVALGCAAAVMYLGIRPVSDNDAWWHLKVGEYLLHGGRLLRARPVEPLRHKAVRGDPMASRGRRLQGLRVVRAACRRMAPVRRDPARVQRNPLVHPPRRGLPSQRSLSRWRR